MKSFVISTLKAIATGYLASKSSMFTIKCSKCGCLGELEYGFLKRDGDIAVVNAGENIVSIQCNKCGNKIVSSEY